MARMNLMTWGLLGGGAFLAWRMLRPKTWAEKLSEIDIPSGFTPEQRAGTEIMRAQDTMAEEALAEEARQAATIAHGFSPIRDLTVEEMLAQYPQSGLTSGRWRLLQERYPNAWLVSNAQAEAMRKSGLVPQRIQVVAADPAVKAPDIGATIAVVPEQMVPASTAESGIMGYGAMYALHGGAGVTGLGY